MSNQHLDKVRPSKDSRLSALGVTALEDNEQSTVMRIRIPSDLHDDISALSAAQRGEILAAWVRQGSFSSTLHDPCNFLQALDDGANDWYSVIPEPHIRDRKIISNAHMIFRDAVRSWTWEGLDQSKLQRLLTPQENWTQIYNYIGSVAWPNNPETLTQWILANLAYLTQIKGYTIEVYYVSDDRRQGKTPLIVPTFNMRKPANLCKPTVAETPTMIESPLIDVATSQQFANQQAQIDTLAQSMKNIESMLRRLTGDGK